MNSKKPYSRVERVEKQILEILNSILIRNIDLTRLGFITFTNIDLSPDFRTAKIFYSVLNPTLSKENICIEINKKRKAFKKYLGPEIHLKLIPDLRFLYDDSHIYEDKIMSLINNKGKNG